MIRTIEYCYRPTKPQLSHPPNKTPTSREMPASQTYVPAVQCPPELNRAIDDLGKVGEPTLSRANARMVLYFFS